MDPVATGTLRDLAHQELRVPQEQHAKAIVAVELCPKDT
jgi:hypothetical protein